MSVTLELAPSPYRRCVYLERSLSIIFQFIRLVYKTKIQDYKLINLIVRISLKLGINFSFNTFLILGRRRISWLQGFSDFVWNLFNFTRSMPLPS